MADKAHVATDKKLLKMERHLSAIYSRANKELTDKAEAYFKRFEELDTKKRKLLDAGKITEQEYKTWRQNKIMTGKHWETLQKQVAERVVQADKDALAYVNGELPSVYTLNYNYVAQGVNSSVRGISFELLNQETVKNLATKNKTLLPYKYVDGKKDVRWNTKNFNAEVLQGILQGENMKDISKRIFPEIKSKIGEGVPDDKMGEVIKKAKNSAIRNARTMVTSAENKGRMDMLHDAESKGVITHKVWLSSNQPGRTRDAHMPGDFNELEVDIDQPFENSIGKIMYPGDPSADPANVYNCRCTLTYKVVGFGRGK